MADSPTLTVQDLIWIHSQVAGAADGWSWARLEEAVAYQFSYGTSTGIASRAANFFTGMVKIKPFPSDNEATAFAAMATFLALNGQTLHLQDNGRSGFVESLLQDPATAEAKIAVKLEPAPHHASEKGFDTQTTAQAVLANYS